MNQIPPTADKSLAYLFANGNAVYCDETGEMIVRLQRNGLCGLHRFVVEYPNAPVYWAVWEKSADRIPPEVLPWLLRHIRKQPALRPNEESPMT